MSDDFRNIIQTKGARTIVRAPLLFSFPPKDLHFLIFQFLHFPIGDRGYFISLKLIGMVISVSKRNPLRRLGSQRDMLRTKWMASSFRASIAL